MAAINVMAQNVKITGTVVDSSNEPIIGATVTVSDDTNVKAVTNVDGRFTINAAPGSNLHITYIGYKTVDVKAADGMRIVMEEESNMLKEVVAIGYGSVQRKDVTTAVSSVSTKDLDTRPIVSAVQGMQGKAAGVTISQANGQPGATPTIRVRGTTSLNGSNDPLYVVDGVPMTDIDYLSADDIVGMQILKDASSAAIYGSRAANGVVIITTKQGKAGEARISLNAHYALNVVRDNQDPLNAAQYKELMDEIGLVKLPDGLTDKTDWKDEVYRTGNVQDYQLSVTNGNDKLRYFISGGYTGENGVIKKSSYERYNIRASVENDIRKWLRVNASVAYSDYSYKGTGIISGTGSNRGGVVTSIVNTPTYAPVWDPDNPGQYYNNFYGVNITSPAENIARTENNKSSYNRLIATGKATIKFMEGLNLTSSLSFDRLQGIETEFLDPIKTTNGRDNYGKGHDGRSISSVWVFDNVLNWKKDFGLHGLDVMAGSSWTASKYSNNYIDGSNYADGLFQTLNAANKISWTGTGSSASEWAILSYFARLQYNWNDRYLFTANIRADGSSKLAPGHRWGYFPSFSGAWRISSEPFMKDIEWINDLKLRGGWGQTGNQSGLGDYSYLASYSINRVQWFGEGFDTNAVPTRTQSTLSNPELTWETTSQTDIGLDLTMFNNRLMLYIDWYYKRTSDMLMTITLPAGSAPARTLNYNGGTMVNKGWEITLKSVNMKGKFSWDTDFNISFNKNKLESLRLTQVYYSAMTTDYVNDYVVRNVPGRPLGSFYGYVAEGVDPETGDMIYKDVNKDGVISASDRTYIGDPNPDFTFGLTNNFSWKGFNLNILLQGSVGNDIYNVSRMETEGMYDGKNQSTKVLDRWRVPGQITNVPKAGWNIKNSSYFVEDGSYLRVKSVSLSYDVPRKIISKLGINRLQPYFTASNLLTWTSYSGMDPETPGATYPISRSVMFSVNVGF